jgi:acetoin:2,6-dichlorophenolindophenol oxidoreductase subunit alpha
VAVTTSPGDGGVRPASGLAASLGLALYTSMLRMRLFEEKVRGFWAQAELRGPIHLGVGQEAVPAGFAAAMRPDDYMLSTYRGHADVISRGAPLDGLMAELFGRATGVSGGKGGSMHLMSVDHGHYGCNAIIGAHLPMACGLGWSARLRRTDQVTVCFFGDGATNIGAFHEALNLAVVWKLPVVFVCNNNLYMEYTRNSEVTAVPRPAADRAGAYGLEAVVADGNDVEAVLRVARAAIARARSLEGASLVETLTYRHYGHSAADPAAYRSTEEVAEWKAKDPIPSYRRVLEERGVSPAELERIEAEVAAEVDDAAERARSAPLPDVASVSTELWSDGGSAWRN